MSSSMNHSCETVFYDVKGQCVFEIDEGVLILDMFALLLGGF